MIAFAIANRFNYKLQDVLTYVGLILIIVGILMSMKGNPSGNSISGIGESNVNYTTYLNNEITRQEREMNPYYKDYFKNNVVKFAFSNLAFILGGIFIIAFGFLFF